MENRLNQHESENYMFHFEEKTRIFERRRQVNINVCVYKI